MRWASLPEEQVEAHSQEVLPNTQQGGRTGQGGDERTNLRTPFLLTEWQETGKGLTKPKQSNKRAVEAWIGWKLQTIHPNPGPRRRDNRRRKEWRRARAVRRGWTDVDGIADLLGTAHPAREEKSKEKRKKIKEGEDKQGG